MLPIANTFVAFSDVFIGFTKSRKTLARDAESNPSPQDAEGRKKMAAKRCPTAGKTGEGWWSTYEGGDEINERGINKCIINCRNNSLG